MTEKLAEEDREQLRLAVVMNGGVSLAIWIGGVCQEINRMQSRRHEAYAGLLDLAWSDPRVDVISGTSAGGLNGAFLAVATISGADLGVLGDLWADRAGLKAMLRPPLQQDPPSLLRGDEYFLPQLRAAFRQVLPEGTDLLDSNQAPMYLTMTTSLLKGSPVAFVDDYGARIVEVQHQAGFRFVRSDRHRPDAFRDRNIREQLALAARSTASFPFAFEPSWIPIGERSTDELHPDMARVVQGFDCSKWVVDGGVLVNKPVANALQDIYAQSAEHQVRRVLAYVNPDPGQQAATDVPDPAVGQPTLAGVLLGTLVTLPRAQTIADELAEIEKHNRAARERHDLRPHQAAALAGLGADADLSRFAPLFDAYRRVRASRAARNVATLVAEELATGAAGAVDRATAIPQWTTTELQTAIAAEATTRPCPFLPAELPAVDRPASLDGWGLAPLERLAATAIDLCRQALWLVPLRSEPAVVELRARLREIRGELHSYRRTLLISRQQDDVFWQHEARRLPAPVTEATGRASRLREWAAAALANWPVSEVDEQEHVHRSASGDRIDPRVLDLACLDELGTRILSRLIQARGDLLAATEAYNERLPDAAGEAHRLAQLVEALLPPGNPGPDGTGGPADQATTPHRGRRETRPDPTTVAVPVDVLDVTVRRLIVAELYSVTFGVDRSPLAHPVELAQISGYTRNWFGAPQTPVGRLAGVQLGHFGAFYKQSWRANDWTWGRIDGATRMTEIILDPARLRQLGTTSAEVEEAVEKLAVAGPDVEYLRARYAAERRARAAELAFLDEPGGGPVPASLPVTALAVARRLHLDILREELPRLAAAVTADDDQGARISPPARALQRAVDRREELPADEMVRVFGNAAIGMETLPEEAGSDLLAATASTAAAVAVSTMDLKGSGLGPARWVLRAVRGVLLLLYALVYGAVAGSRFGAAVVNLALAVGGAMLALALLGTSVPGVVTMLATALVLAAIGMAALRARLWVLAVALALPLGGLVAAVAVQRPWRSIVDQATTILIVVGLVVAVMLLGLVHQPGQAARARRSARRRPSRTRR